MSRSIIAAAILALASTSALAEESKYPTYWINGGDNTKVDSKYLKTDVGFNNSAYVLQQGYQNYTVNDQHGVYNKSQDIQYGQKNVNGTYQAGWYNAELTYQGGTANLAMTTQQGIYNVAQHVQIGEYNRSLIDQRGVYNVAANFQSGWNGTIYYHGAVPVYGPNLDFRPHHYYGQFNDVKYSAYPPATLPGGAVKQ